MEICQGEGSKVLEVPLGGRFGNRTVVDRHLPYLMDGTGDG